ncbi:MAG: hypothetical protein ACXABD_21645 [Candidatus Thorarchaeota archaeon]|jgi:hypothetical protein
MKLSPTGTVYEKDAWRIRHLIKQEYIIVHLHTDIEARTPSSYLSAWRKCTICGGEPPEEIKKIYTMLTLESPEKIYWGYFHHHLYSK